MAVTVCFSFVNFPKKEEETVSTETIEYIKDVFLEDTYIQITDDYVDDTALSELYSGENALERVKDFNRVLNEEFNYYELSFQPLQQYYFFDLSDDFVMIYNSKGGKIHNQKVNIDGEETYVTSLNTIKVDEKFFDEYLNHLDSGEKFSQEDFQFYSIAEEIPVILGSHYADYFKIGERLYLNYLDNNLTFYVKGFFEEGLQFKYNKENIQIDNYICMPNFEINIPVKDRDDFLLQMRHYLQKNSGFIKYEKESDLKVIEKSLEQLSNKYLLEYVLIYSPVQIKCEKEN